LRPSGRGGGSAPRRIDGYIAAGIERIGADGDAIINEHGAALKRRSMATPFKFYECVPLVKLTGRKTDNIIGLLEIMKDISPESIFHHMHQYFLKPDIHITPEYHNDFAIWVAQALGDRALAERLANLNPFAYQKIEDVRLGIIDIITKHLKEYPQPRHALRGDEFFFNEGVTLVMPSGYEAATLVEFSRALEEVDPSSIYFHFYEARLRLGQEGDDFSRFFAECLDCAELASKISSLDPYMYNTEMLREKLLRLIKAEIA